MSFSLTRDNTPKVLPQPKITKYLQLFKPTIHEMLVISVFPTIDLAFLYTFQEMVYNMQRVHHFQHDSRTGTFLLSYLSTWCCRYNNSLYRVGIRYNHFCLLSS
nr:MAG TPA: hypothetical protein [Caudoviricetes sp.]